MHPYIILMTFSNFKVYFLATWWWLRLEPKSAAAGLQQRIGIPAEPEPCLRGDPTYRAIWRTVTLPIQRETFQGTMHMSGFTEPSCKSQDKHRSEPLH